jgi:hypothetical protein
MLCGRVLLCPSPPRPLPQAALLWLATGQAVQEPARAGKRARVGAADDDVEEAPPDPVAPVASPWVCDIRCLDVTGCDLGPLAGVVNVCTSDARMRRLRLLAASAAGRDADSREALAGLFARRPRLVVDVGEPGARRSSHVIGTGSSCAEAEQ